MFPGVPATTPSAPGPDRPWCSAALGLLVLAPALGEDGPVAPPLAPPLAPVEVLVTAPEPRYVAPTLRDRIGRIWAPVYLDGQGPFRLVLDTGASASAVTVGTAARLGISLEGRPTIQVRGVTGTVDVPVIEVGQLEVGDMLFETPTLLVLEDAFGGAEGVLATAGLGDRRIHIEFRRDRIEIVRSSSGRAPRGFVTIPVRLVRGHVPVIDARVGNIRVRGIIDTGAQQTTANPALRRALDRRGRQGDPRPEGVIGVSGDVQAGTSLAVPPIVLGGVAIRNARITFADLKIFDHWELTEEPAVLIGMDVWGVLDTMIIDYRRRELQIRLLGDRG